MVFSNTADATILCLLKRKVLRRFLVIQFLTTMIWTELDLNEGLW